jgi:hypothetical protein
VNLLMIQFTVASSVLLTFPFFHPQNVYQSELAQPQNKCTSESKKLNMLSSQVTALEMKKQYLDQLPDAPLPPPAHHDPNAQMRRTVPPIDTHMQQLPARRQPITTTQKPQPKSRSKAAKNTQEGAVKKRSKSDEQSLPPSSAAPPTAPRSSAQQPSEPQSPSAQPTAIEEDKPAEYLTFDPAFNHIAVIQLLGGKDMFLNELKCRLGAHSLDHTGSIGPGTLDDMIMGAFNACDKAINKPKTAPDPDTTTFLTELCGTFMAACKATFPSTNGSFSAKRALLLFKCLVHTLDNLYVFQAPEQAQDEGADGTSLNMS